MAAFEQIWKSATGNPAVDFTGKRYTFVTYDSSGNLVNSSAAGLAIGVIQEPNKQNEPAQVAVHGFSFIQLGGTVAIGAEVEVGSNGAAVTLASGKSVGICVVGGGSGDIGTVLLK
jgi:hypothetical protein